MRPTLLLLLGLSLCPLQGCCSLARLFCGPDRSPWISQRFDSAHQTARTLFEAIRRDDAEVVYLCMSQRFRQRHGLDGLIAQVAWERFREQTPGLHVAGYAEVPAPTLLGPDRATVTVDVEGRRVEVDLEREARWEVRFRLANGTEQEQGAVVPSFAGNARVEAVDDPNEDRSRLLLLPIDLYHDNQALLPLEAIEHAALTHQWKVADVRVRQ